MKCDILPDFQVMGYTDPVLHEEMYIVLIYDEIDAQYYAYLYKGGVVHIDKPIPLSMGHLGRITVKQLLNIFQITGVDSIKLINYDYPT